MQTELKNLITETNKIIPMVEEALTLLKKYRNVDSQLMNKNVLENALCSLKMAHSGLKEINQSFYAKLGEIYYENTKNS